MQTHDPVFGRSARREAAWEPGQRARATVNVHTQAAICRRYSVELVDRPIVKLNAPLEAKVSLSLS
jgi:hypothetical protein